VKPSGRAASLAIPLLVVVLAACERPPMETEQRGYRGLAIETVSNPRAEAEKVAANQVPEPLPPAQDGPPTTDLFQNIQVLGDTSATQFTRLMGAITQWVSPQQGCGYCHQGANFVAEGVYTKDVARRMIQMTRRINSEWKDHVGPTGVTCYTCHRGQPVPAEYWVEHPGQVRMAGMLGDDAGQNAPASHIGLTSLPYDPFSSYLRDPGEVRIQAASALPMGTHTGIKDAEHTYGFMVHISQSLGVNCTYCHNSRAFMPWEQSSPARVKAWHAIRMVRELNLEFMEPLVDVFPANRKGPKGDVYKIHCGTCHQGLPKPLLGVSMVADYPTLAE